MEVKKILVIGCSGVGKSTFAKKISKQTNLPYTATDPFYWEANWKQANTKKVIEHLTVATSASRWVLDGNFDDQRELVWQQADLIIWLDYPFWIVLYQITKRNLGWWLIQKPTWSGNRMTWKRAISGIRHSMKSHKKKRLHYPEYLAECSNVEVKHFQTSNEAKQWLSLELQDKTGIPNQ